MLHLWALQGLYIKVIDDYCDVRCNSNNYLYSMRSVCLWILRRFLMCLDCLKFYRLSDVKLRDTYIIFRKENVKLKVVG